MTRQQLMRCLETACLQAGSQATYARSIGVTPQFVSNVLVSNVLAGTKPPSARLLWALGFRRVVHKTISYEPIGKAA
jgi:hypothetical protein